MNAPPLEAGRSASLYASTITSPDRAILVIGGGGLVGRHVAAAFAGRKVVLTYHRSRIPGGVPLDITDRSTTAAMIRDMDADVIVLAAAEPYVERCEREPAATRAVNVVAARTVAEAARARGALLIVFSSEYVFDGTKGRYLEDDPVAPLNEYGRQKVELEAIARTLPRHIVCRTSGVFGWEPERKNFVAQLIDHLRAGREFLVPSDQLITPTYAADLARTLAALTAYGTVGTIHLVGPKILRRTEFASMVCQAFGLPADLIVPRRTDELGLAAPRPRNAGLADDRARRILGVPLPDPASALVDMRRTEDIAAAPA